MTVPGVEGTRRPSEVTARPAYGVDAPSVVMLFLGLTVAATFIGIFVGSAVGVGASIGFWVAAAGFGLVCAALFASSLAGKRRLWREVLDGLALRGDEQALDVGCGRGLVAIETARRLPNGAVTGIDLWRNRDQSGNSAAVARLNAEIAGVADRVEVRDGDMRTLPFADDRFDLVTAGLALHHGADAAERERSVHEMARVLRPGGRIVIVDHAATTLAERVLRDLGLRVERSGRRWWTAPASRVVTAVAE